MREAAGLCIPLVLVLAIFTFMVFTIAIPVSVSAQIATVVSIGNIEVAPDSTTTIPIMINNVTNLGSGTIDVSYNPEIVHVTDVESGTGNALMVHSGNADNVNGNVQIAAWDTNTPHSGDVIFANLSFKAVASTGSTPLNLSVEDLEDYYNYTQIPHTTNPGTFTITPSNVPVTTISLSANPEIIIADGFSTAALTACLRTNSNPAAAGTEVNFSTTFGTIQSPTYTDAQGNATSILTSSTLPGTAVVTATSGTANATTQVLFTPIQQDSGNESIPDSDSDENHDLDTSTQEASTSASVSIAPVTAPPDGSVTVPIMANHVTNLGSGTIDLAYNPEIVHVTDVESGTGNALVVQSHSINNTIGLVQIVALDANAPHSGSVIFANVVFRAVATSGSTLLHISVRDLIDYQNYTLIPHSVNNGILTIAGVGVAVYGLVLTVDTEEKTTAPGVNATYSLTVQNTGTVGDSFALSVDNPDNAAVATLSSNSVTIPAGDTATVLLNVTNPTEGRYHVHVIATSQGNTIKSDTITTRTIATSAFSATSESEPEPAKPINPILIISLVAFSIIAITIIAFVLVKFKYYRQGGG